VIVKQSFQSLFAEKSNVKLSRTIIYGTDANAISVAKALKLESPLRFKIVAFIDRNGQNSSKRMLDLPIFDFKEKLPTLMRSVGEGVPIKVCQRKND
jgi:FlaA1/EpsC-like NDP-sugar epimerase